MSSPGFGWQSLLHTDAPRECSLQAALFTTYDRADAFFLAEHLLPKLLKLDRAPDPDGAEQKHFLVDLDHRLKQLHDHLVIVSSVAREEPSHAGDGEGGGYPWIWRSIRHLSVGSRGPAVQHAKLWMLHWRDAKGDEYLEIVVSSANLTRAAFRDQLQAAWRAYIKLEPQATRARLARWGVLPDFLGELAAYSGDDGRLEPFVELLRRAECPPKVTFVASVPGRHGRDALRRKPWGAAGLEAITPPGRGTVSATILCPFVGSWSAEALGRWCDRVGGSLGSLGLIWIDRDHPWASAGKWLLPEATLRTLSEGGASLLHLRHHADDRGRFHDEHHPADDRWSHAKVYLFKRGPSRRLLVTSANFSPAAWGKRNGDGTLTIENFELGVCIEQAAWRFQAIESFEDARDAATVEELPGRRSAPISWAEAVWDGQYVDVACRCDYRDLTGEIRGGHDLTPITDWTFDPSGLLRSAHIPWQDAERPPLLARLTCGEESLNIPVFDRRPWPDRKDAIPPEIADEAGEDLLRLRDELLFEQYGGRVASDADGGAPNDNGNAPDDDGQGDGYARRESYSVAALELARMHLKVVDDWAGQVAAQEVGEFDRERLRRDGELLRDAFRRRAERDGQQDPAGAIGARLAAEEMNLRLKHFPEA